MIHFSLINYPVGLFLSERRTLWDQDEMSNPYIAVLLDLAKALDREGEMEWASGLKGSLKSSYRDCCIMHGPRNK